MLTVVLPAYNESAGLGALLTGIGLAVAQAGAYDILVVDDGSTDETSAIARRAAQSLPVRILSHSVNLGYGRALRTGLLEALRNGGTIITLDADGSHDPALIPSMQVEIDAGSDLVIASRFRPGGAEIGVPWNRRLLSRCASLVFRSSLSISGLRDYTSGYRAYRSSLLEGMIRAHGPKGFLRSRDFAAGFELLLKAVSLEARIAEVPLQLHYDRKRSTSKMRVTRDVPPYFSLLLGHHFRARSAKGGP